LGVQVWICVEGEGEMSSKAEIGAKGGKVNSALQRKTRMRNLYKALLKKWPNSAAVRRKLKELGE
jgi:hypothetical protein